jgi:glycosyltransferase involved in cell wall biosynthesis/GT2 family glycosyltransferase
MAQQAQEPTPLAFRGLRVALLASGPSGGHAGGAERFFEGLLGGLRELGVDSELVFIPADEPTFDAILANHDRCAAMDLTQFDVVISTKAPTYAITHPAHVVYLIHTVRVFDDMFDDQFPSPSLAVLEQRAALHERESRPLSTAKAKFAIGHEVAGRLYRWRGLHADVIHPPLVSNPFHQGAGGDYFFLPGRLHRWKRVDLVIQAILASSHPLKLKIAGTGEDEVVLKKLANNDPRIEFLGQVDDEQLIELYAGALAVPFVPLREDYGYVTLEAFASGKPVVTCTDSGEPTRLVRHGENGFICQPDPQALCEVLEALHLNHAMAETMGNQGAKFVLQMPSWPEVARQLVTAALTGTPNDCSLLTKVAVIDMQPIDPPVGGGRLRLLGLYHHLGERTDCTYVGTYDWPGEAYRCHQLSKTLREIDVPLSDAHHAAAAALAGRAKGKVVIDLAFSQQAELSPDYLAAAREQLVAADVVVFSHPWVYPLLKDNLRPDQVLIYDSQNVEGYLRAQLLDEDNPVEAQLLRRVVQDENDMGWAADWILACSHEDLLRFHRVYGFPLDKMRVVPNGVMAFRDPVPTPDTRRDARRTLKLAEDAPIAIFIGSPYGPNVQAAQFIADALAPLLPDVTFVIAGGVGQVIQSGLPNVRITGNLSEADKTLWLTASDMAVNPMMAGSGTNIKMFDFMAMGLPVVTTEIGARGIEMGGRRAMLVAQSTTAAFCAAIERLKDPEMRRLIGQEARQCVQEGYAWERISEQLGCFIEARQRMAGQSTPLFSVVIPTYERHDQLESLVVQLQKQIERDFEVVVVDQSADRWLGAECHHGFPLTYYHSPVKGAVRARNTGAMLAQGSIIAFVDDDCLPSHDWLVNARAYFKDHEVVAVEGRIHSDHLDDPDWRPVSNVGFEGIGFMTANLFVRSTAFQYSGGFDLQFDCPHFREDTDLGWRLKDLGKVPYAHDVRVFHPAQKREKQRESAAERAKFFQKDALLYRKQPEKYQHLFMAERHFEHTPGFRRHLLEGFKAADIQVPEWMSSLLKEQE